MAVSLVNNRDAQRLLDGNVKRTPTLTSLTSRQLPEPGSRSLASRRRNRANVDELVKRLNVTGYSTRVLGNAAGTAIGKNAVEC